MLFAKMSAIWMQKWTNNLTDEKILELALLEWENVLSKLTNEQITMAIEACKNTLAFPPSISEFKKYALQIPPREAAYNLYTIKSGDSFTVKIKDKISSSHFKMMSFQDSRVYFFSIYDALVVEILTNN